MTFPAAGFSFLRELENNNNRVWFKANKDQFCSTLQEPFEELTHSLTGLLSTLLKTDMACKTFRIHRDVRFSKDKTPYNTHMRAAFWNAENNVKKPIAGPAFYLSIEPNSVHIGGGCMEMPPAILSGYRHYVNKDGAELKTLMKQLENKGARFDSPSLKRIPNGFDKSHPHETLLRRKGLTCWFDTMVCDPEPFTPSQAMEAFKECTAIYKIVRELV